jgi:hypothetical protein
MCRCGRTQKNFHNDIGEFFVDKCCRSAGYDHFGNLLGQIELKQVEPRDKDLTPVEAPKDSGLFKIARTVPGPNDRLSKNKVKDLNLAELNKVASDRGMVVTGMTRQQIITALLTVSTAEVK